MLQERIEARWIDAFARVFDLCGIERRDAVAVLCESQTRPVLIALSELAAGRLGARLFRVTVPTPEQTVAVPIRSTGASQALSGLRPVIDALAGATLVVDCTVEGLLHASELPAILEGGARVLMVSDEHPEILERLVPEPSLEPKVRTGMRYLKRAKTMHVASAAGTDLTVDLSGARVGGGWGYTAKPGTIAHWPGGLCLCFPKAGSVDGTLVLAAGDLNLTFKRYIEKAVTLIIKNDFVTRIDGEGVDAELLRSYFAAWGEREAYAVSHVGWGMNPRARWDALAFYDRKDCNGTEARAFAGNFLYSTGANEMAGRHTLGHFDLPLKGCTVSLDGEPMVIDGALQGELA